MISKYYEIEKFKNKSNYFLFYGENEGQKQDVIQANFNQFKKELSKININKIDYLEIRDEKNLEITSNYDHARLFIAVFIDKIRIIDNFKLY